MPAADTDVMRSGWQFGLPKGWKRFKVAWISFLLKMKLSKIVSKATVYAIALASTLGVSATSAKAGVVSLDFEGINAAYPSGTYAAI